MPLDPMLAATLAHLDQGVALFGPDGGLLLCNERFAPLFRVKSEQCAVGTPIRRLLEIKAKRGDFGPVDIDLLSSPLVRSREYERPSSGDGRSLHELFQPLEGGGVLVVASDVSAARDLAVTSAKLRRLSRFPEENPNPVMRFGPDGRLNYANRASGPVLARMERRVGDAAPSDWALWLVEARDAGHPVERTFEREEAVYSLLLCPVPETGDTNVYGRDITERVRHEEALRVAKEAADQANLTKSQFLANMSHELRTPMNAIMGFTRLVMRKSKDELAPRQYGNLEKILVSAEHLLSLINDILDLSKIEAGRLEVHPESFDPLELAELCLRTVEPMAADCVVIRGDLPAAHPRLFNDAAKVKQVLLNLLSNAAKFTREGSITLSLRHDGGLVAFSVSDTGVGIPADALEAVFDEFKQVDGSSTREFGGTGLGLAISRRLARLLGGDIVARSELGVGSTFTFTVSARFGEAIETESDGNSTAADSPPKRRSSILVVDDDADAAYLVSENLREAGYDVLLAHGGHEALRLAREARPSAIALDVKMADMDGWQVLHHLKADPHTRGIPVVLLTVVDDRPLAFQLGAADYLLKPFDRDAFLSSLGRVLGGRGNLLVVDDDPDVRDLVGEMLEGEPIELRFARDGAEALDAVRAQIPDAIFLDLMMPVLDGFGVLQALRADHRHRAIPVVVFTAKILSAEERAVLDQRVVAVVAKDGVDARELVSELHRALGWEDG